MGGGSRSKAGRVKKKIAMARQAYAIGVLGRQPSYIKRDEVAPEKDRREKGKN